MVDIERLHLIFNYIQRSTTLQSHNRDIMQPLAGAFFRCHSRFAKTEKTDEHENLKNKNHGKSSDAKRNNTLLQRLHNSFLTTPVNQMYLYGIRLRMKSVQVLPSLIYKNLLTLLSSSLHVTISVVKPILSWLAMVGLVHYEADFLLRCELRHLQLSHEKGGRNLVLKELNKPPEIIATITSHIPHDMACQR